MEFCGNKERDLSLGSFLESWMLSCGSTSRIFVLTRIQLFRFRFLFPSLLPTLPLAPLAQLKAAARTPFTCTASTNGLDRMAVKVNVLWIG